MPKQIEISVGPKQGDLTGSNHLVLQAAVDYVSRLGGGTVRLLPGVYEMGNSLFLRDHLRLVGAGEKTVLRKPPSRATQLTDDIDWYGTAVRVADSSIFTVGGGILLRGRCPHYDKRIFVKRTVVAIDGDVVFLDEDPRENLWIDCEADAATLYPVVTGNKVNDILIENVTIDGNRPENENLNGNYGGGIFLQDCDRVTIRGVTSQNNNGDGISWQVCDDVTIESCQSLHNSDLGLHPGSGSQRPVIVNNVAIGNDIGLFFCWGVKHGRAENNVIEDSGKHGISIGHRDTDNLIRGNQVRRSGQHGVIFRSHPLSARDPHRNLLENNLIEDSGRRGDCVAVEMLGTAAEVTLRGNHLQDTRRRAKTRRRLGLRIGEQIGQLCLESNRFSGFEQDVLDLRHNSENAQP